MDSPVQSHFQWPQGPVPQFGPGLRGPHSQCNFLMWNDSIRWNDTLRDIRKMEPNFTFEQKIFCFPNNSRLDRRLLNYKVFNSFWFYILYISCLKMNVHHNIFSPWGKKSSPNCDKSISMCCLRRGTYHHGPAAKKEESDVTFWQKNPTSFSPMRQNWQNI